MNNDILDTYQLKSLDGFLDIDLRQARLEFHDGKYYLMPNQEYLDKIGAPKHNSTLFQPFAPEFMKVSYDKVVRCLGFKFDFSVFNK